MSHLLLKSLAVFGAHFWVYCWACCKYLAPLCKYVFKINTISIECCIEREPVFELTIIFVFIFNRWGKNIHLLFLLVKISLYCLAFSFFLSLPLTQKHTQTRMHTHLLLTPWCLLVFVSLAVRNNAWSSTAIFLSSDNKQLDLWSPPPPKKKNKRRGTWRQEQLMELPTPFP